ncbi:TetR/AcrR family transcriptional regulator [Pseudonocardia sp. KRD291]|uniref:TetR/AcrR family transcriptional regulator n=1 Tax=Pseudonocardia sp. KRD291 TaxID=2792007 RepID=UPI001C4A1067|nr:TetR/AcrR family transcriptional regulator [Pseudonocardia sp. KRD291]MBW0102576.1 TetR family transcriptional regulator [Pseudonocardia sp. KRD291]
MSSGIGKRRESARGEGTAAYQERRTEIVAAAGQLFKDNGYAGTSLADVAEALSMDRASLYYYIGGKQELFQDVVGGAVERNALSAEEIVSGPGTAPEKLRRLVVELMVSYAESYPFLYVYIQEHLGAVSPDRSAWAQRMRGYNKRYENAVVAVVAAGVDEGTFAVGTQPWVVAYGIIGMVAWSNRWYRPGDTAIPAREIGEAYADTLLTGLQVR